MHRIALELVAIVACPHVDLLASKLGGKASTNLGAPHIRVLDRGSETVILAPHGGWIEPDTSEIAKAIAGSDISFYAFEALRNGPHGHFHITSHRFDEPEAVSLVGRCWTAVAIHGRRNEGADAVWLGGRATKLRDAVGDSLRAAGFKAELNERLPGLEGTNICNRTRAGEGVQLEISRRLRSQLVADANLLQSFCEAVRISVLPASAI
ncbi:poly-gamma-glutamate hydrolase family protein [Sulfitobacter sp. PR48]|uniref:poly-gamma-glutamate hydrolase family protein n=1 Tax=Sulfitobacter sp. PR48 TaxID=3028383 RepID=UPI00237BDD59|nr:poly-gamma-glutamate hydrolase family protein [Sulfitobacter sp. PR48]MDD9722067.1 poly-gamma-glutamate hydrolase family protein [Sulfitobacter sp. PR48]